MSLKWFDRPNQNTMFYQYTTLHFVYANFQTSMINTLATIFKKVPVTHGTKLCSPKMNHYFSSPSYVRLKSINVVIFRANRIYCWPLYMQSLMPVQLLVQKICSMEWTYLPLHTGRYTRDILNFQMWSHLLTIIVVFVYLLFIFIVFIRVTLTWTKCYYAIWYQQENVTNV